MGRKKDRELRMRCLWLKAKGVTKERSGLAHPLTNQTRTECLIMVPLIVNQNEVTLIVAQAFPTSMSELKVVIKITLVANV